MGLGAIIASGDDNHLLSEDLLGCITEVRVEQVLDEPTIFAIRFQEDITAGEPTIMKAAQLQPEQIITIAVEIQDEMKCLVRGPITEVKCSVMLGGPGSWFEIQGQDRRVELNRLCFKHAWEGRSSEAVQKILSDYNFNADTQETPKIYSQETGTLNQRSTDLEFIKTIAQQNNLCLWISYTSQLDSLDPMQKALKVEETAHVKSSPERPQDNATDTNGGGVTLQPSVDIRLRVNVDQDQCQNVTVFEMDVDIERPNCFTGTALNDKDLQQDGTSVADTQPPIKVDGSGLSNLTVHNREICLTTAGDHEELQVKAESALTEAGWFINATASTTAHMLGNVLIPHDVVEVDGLGLEHSGAYQVKSVTHVINAADHHMDLALRRNSLGGG